VAAFVSLEIANRDRYGSLKIARVFVRLDHIGSFIVNRITASCDRLAADANVILLGHVDTVDGAKDFSVVFRLLDNEGKRFTTKTPRMKNTLWTANLRKYFARSA
jgi:hypothetical protein